ncbi:hypothetical protein BDB01DRAFT_798261 [Pilobolus umbonatus]|nr:hypothetical protein BDB01DRAFT_798261 [Pilobolus umbonatus]
MNLMHRSRLLFQHIKPIKSTGRCFYATYKDGRIYTNASKFPKPTIPSFMPANYISMTEFALDAFYSMHRPLSLYSSNKCKMHIEYDQKGKIEDDQKEVEDQLKSPDNHHTVTLTIDIDSSHSLYHDQNELINYLSIIQDKLNLLYCQRSNMALSKRKLRRIRKHRRDDDKN